MRWTRSTARRGCFWIPTSGRKTARSPWPEWASAMTANTWPTAAPRPAPTGPPGTCWRSPRGKLLPDELKWTKCVQRLVDQGRQGHFLQPLRRASPRRRVPGPQLQQQALLPPRRHAAVGRRAGLLAAGSARHGATTAEVSDDGRYLVISICGTGERSVANLRPRSRRALRHAGRTGRQLQARVPFVGNEGPVLYLQDRLRRPAPPADGHRPAQAEAGATGRRSFPSAKRRSTQ